MMSRLAVHEMEELTVRYLEKALLMREWGRMARAGLGLGYGSCTLDDGKPGEPLLSVEQFERLTQEIQKLPERPRAVVISIYKLENSVAETAVKMADRRHNIERHQRAALNILYGSLCGRTNA